MAARNNIEALTTRATTKPHGLVARHTTHGVTANG